MRSSFVCLPALASCATAFVVNVPPTAGPQAVATGAYSARRMTSLWVSRPSPEEQADRDMLEEQRRVDAPKDDGPAQEIEELDLYGNPVVDTQTIRVDPWGASKTMVIGKDKINYSAFRGARTPAILYLPAFDAPARDFKAERLREWCDKEDYSFISLEWLGVGDSDGAFESGTISRWKQDAVTLIAKLLPQAYQKVVIVGGGVGGWIATLIALDLETKVTGIVGLAADPDFTHNLLMRYLPKAKLDEINTKGVATIKWGQAIYPVTKSLIDDAADNLVLQGPVGGLPIDCPVRLIHGLDDEEVPYTVSLDLCRRLSSKNVNLYLVKTANHHLDNTSILNTVISSLEEVIKYAPRDPPRRDIA